MPGITEGLRSMFPGILVGPDKTSDCVVANEEIEHWSYIEPQPSVATIQSHMASPEFAAWEDEHGIDPVKTKRRIVRDLLQSDDPAVKLLIAFLRAYAKREGLTRAQVLAALDAEIDTEIS